MRVDGQTDGQTERTLVTILRKAPPVGGEVIISDTMLVGLEGSIRVDSLSSCTT